MCNTVDRPRTARSKCDEELTSRGTCRDGRPRTGLDRSPLVNSTSSSSNNNNGNSCSNSPGFTPPNSRNSTQKFRPKTANTIKSNPAIDGQFVTIQLGGNYGDISEIGLTSIKILNKNCEPMKLSPKQIYFQSPNGDKVSCEMLVNDVDITNDMDQMWLMPCSSYYVPYSYMFHIKLAKPQPIKGLLIYNYNANEEDSYKGVRNIKVFIDKEIVTPPDGYILRKAPGNKSFDYGQLIPLKLNQSSSVTIRIYYYYINYISLFFFTFFSLFFHSFFTFFFFHPTFFIDFYE